ncbi:hypothetical protein FEF09_20625 [Chitinophaga pinensis]|uniref:Uncharacterized protein n=1 Tax=Chitinophaga pinensis TaxID=79329 RepID=A0A5C6LQD0_9BACT|nr:hypothetical protein FEF09_20625 [Chitinophaga pinensis]
MFLQPGFCFFPFEFFEQDGFFFAVQFCNGFLFTQFFFQQFFFPFFFFCTQFGYCFLPAYFFFYQFLFSSFLSVFQFIPALQAFLYEIGFLFV